MLDVAVSYNRYKFLGHEFLTWLWFMIDKQPAALGDGENAFLEIGNRMCLEKRKDERVETITIMGDHAGLEEGVLALRKGAVVTEMNLVYKENELEWRFSVKGESLGISSLRSPSTGPAESDEDLEGVVLEKIYLYDKVVQRVDTLYKQFLALRVSPDWNKSVVRKMRNWIKE